MNFKDTFFSKNQSLVCNGKIIDLSTPKVMGILNVTPDSFYDGGEFTKPEMIHNQVTKMITEGASIIDVGACSTRPGAELITVNEEKERLTAALGTIRSSYPDIILSVDTFRSEIAGYVTQVFKADMINDISGGEQDENMFSTIAEINVPYVIMHMKGTPKTMQSLTQYNNLQKEIMQYFSKKINELNRLGVNDIIIDPGFGFSKTLDQNFLLLNNLQDFRIFELPIMVGLSRKSMIYRFLGHNAEEALNGTSILNTIALLKGVHLLRVHDVKEAIESIKLVKKTIGSVYTTF